MMNAAMVEAYGTTSSGGVWSQRDSFQMVETAAMLALQQLDLPRNPVEALDTLAALEDRLPTQTVRSEEQINHQHFSTPLGLAWLVAQFADLQPDDHVLEPSAGTGMLAIWARPTTRLNLNEIDPLRQSILRHLFPDAAVTGFDAARIGAHLEGRPSVVLMNPPFARNAVPDRRTLSLLPAIWLRRSVPCGRAAASSQSCPDGFQSQGRQSDVFKRVLQGASVVFNARLEKAYARHGTSIPIRMLVIDKRLGAISTTVINRAKCGRPAAVPRKSPAAWLAVGKDRQTVTKSHANAVPKSGVLLGGFSAARPISARPMLPASGANDATPLDYSLRDTIADAEQAVGVYVAYRPQRLIFADAPPITRRRWWNHRRWPLSHCRRPDYVPQLPAKVIRERVLWRAQLETLVHALEATSSDLPGRYRIPERGLELVPDADGATYRRGFFLGDGTGAGKGRQLASILMDQWLRGSRRHLWISESNALIEDARRDWQALGGMVLDIQPLSKIKPEAKIRQADGILFASYATLRSGTGEKTRHQQLLEWLAPGD